MWVYWMYIDSYILLYPTLYKALDHILQWKKKRIISTYSYSVNNRNCSRRRTIFPVRSVPKQMSSKGVWGKMFLHSLWLNPSIIKPWAGLNPSGPAASLPLKMTSWKKRLHWLLLQEPRGTEATTAQEVIANLTAAIVRQITNLNYNLRIVDFTRADRQNTDVL